MGPDDGENEASESEKIMAQWNRRFQNLLDKSTIYLKSRWAFFFLSLLLFLVRIYFAEGWYIVCYGLGIFLLNNFIGFLSPQIDPELDFDSPLLPTDGSSEFKPFSRKVPEFKFWYASTRGVYIALCMSFLRVFDIPVFWPILLIYWVALVFATMRKQIQHMVKHRYVPWSWGKTTYSGKDPLFAASGGKGK